MLCKLLRALKFEGARHEPGTELELPDALVATLPHGTVSVAVAPMSPLRDDGPTLEEFVGAGYRPEHYPPEGYEEKPSAGLTDFRLEQKAEALRQAQLRVSAVVGAGNAAKREEENPALVQKKK